MANQILKSVGGIAVALAIAAPISYFTLKHQDEKLVKQSVSGLEYGLVLETEKRDFTNCNENGKGFVNITTSTDYFNKINDKEAAYGVGSLIEIPCNKYNLQTGERLE
jgi:hypothetical protein